MAVPKLNATDQFALKIILRCEQRDRAVAGVIKGFCLDMADRQMQLRLRSLQCLNRTSFVAAEHQCLVGRIQIQTDDIPEFFYKLNWAHE